jgi:hypothetical protein
VLKSAAQLYMSGADLANELVRIDRRTAHDLQQAILTASQTYDAFVTLVTRCSVLQDYQAGTLPTELEIANHWVSAAYVNGIMKMCAPK